MFEAPGDSAGRLTPHSVLFGALPERPLVVVATLVGLVWAAAKVAIPFAARQAVDEAIVPSDLQALWPYIAAILVLGVVQGVAAGLRRYLAIRISVRGETRLRERLFAHATLLGLEYHTRMPAGQLMSRANTDLLQIRNVVVFVPLVLSNVVTFAAVVAVLAAIDWILALISLLCLPGVFVAAVRMGRRLAPLMEATQLELAAFSEDVEESITGIRVVKAFGHEPEMAVEAARHSDRIRDVTVEAGSVRARYLPVFQAMPTLAVVLALAAGGARVIAGTASLGDLVAFNTYVLMLVQPLVLVGMVVAHYHRAYASAERVCEVLAEEPGVCSHPGAAELPDGPGRVEFRDVTFAYPGRRPVLDGFDMEIEPGRTVALVGPTGSGKTTVAKLLARFHDVGAGAVLIDGADVRKVDLDSLRRAVAIVFEDTFLFSGTVAENVSFGRPDATESEIEWATSAAGADEFLTWLEDGYETRVGEQGYTLSGGQRQRLAIARALLAGPRVLVLDDATSAVDAETEARIRESLRAMAGGCTTLVIARRPQTVVLADEVVLLDEGRVVMRGTHAELLAADDRYARLLGMEVMT